jgi:hypothetical protein
VIRGRGAELFGPPAAGVMPRATARRLYPRRRRRSRPGSGPRSRILRQSSWAATRRGPRPVSASAGTRSRCTGTTGGEGPGWTSADTTRAVRRAMAPHRGSVRPGRDHLVQGRGGYRGHAVGGRRGRPGSCSRARGSAARPGLWVSSTRARVWSIARTARQIATDRLGRWCRRILSGPT